MLQLVGLGRHLSFAQQGMQSIKVDVGNNTRFYRPCSMPCDAEENRLSLHTKDLQVSLLRMSYILNIKLLTINKY